MCVCADLDEYVVEAGGLADFAASRTQFGAHC